MTSGFFGRLVMRVTCAAIEASPLRNVSSPRSAVVAGELLPALAHAGAERFRVGDGVVEEDIGRLPALLLVGPFGEQRALRLAGVGGRVGERADALDAELRVGRAGEGDDVVLLRDDRRRARRSRSRSGRGSPWRPCRSPRPRRRRRAAARTCCRTRRSRSAGRARRPAALISSTASFAPAIVSASIGWNQPLNDITSPKIGLSCACAPDETKDTAVAMNAAASKTRFVMLKLPCSPYDQGRLSAFLIKKEWNSFLIRLQAILRGLPSSGKCRFWVQWLTITATLLRYKRTIQ